MSGTHNVFRLASDGSQQYCWVLIYKLTCIRLILLGVTFRLVYYRNVYHQRVVRDIFYFDGVDRLHKLADEGRLY